MSGPELNRYRKKIIEDSTVLTNLNFAYNFKQMQSGKNVCRI